MSNFLFRVKRDRQNKQRSVAEKTVETHEQIFEMKSAFTERTTFDVQQFHTFKRVKIMAVGKQSGNRRETHFLRLVYPPHGIRAHDLVAAEFGAQAIHGAAELLVAVAAFGRIGKQAELFVAFGRESADAKTDQAHR